jgi:hypothetical protein
MYYENTSFLESCNYMHVLQLMETTWRVGVCWGSSVIVYVRTLQLKVSLHKPANLIPLLIFCIILIQLLGFVQVRDGMKLELDTPETNIKTQAT